MQIVEFYRGERGNHNGHLLSEIMTWSHGALEVDHDYVQWIFPSNEPSSLNCDAPTMTKQESEIFQADPELQEAVKQSFIKFLGFLGFELYEDDVQILIKPLDPTPGRPSPQWWLRGAFDHNILRTTRMMKSLRLTGLPQYSLAMYNALKALPDTRISENTWKHWGRAVNDPLWNESWTQFGF